MFHNLRHPHYQHMEDVFNSLKARPSSTLTSQACLRSTSRRTLACLASRTRRASKVATCSGSSLEVKYSTYSISLETALIVKTFNELS